MGTITTNKTDIAQYHILSMNGTEIQSGKMDNQTRIKIKSRYILFAGEVAE